MALGHLDELQKADTYRIKWSLQTGFTVSWSTLVQVIMACHLYGAKPSPEPMLTYFQLYLQEQILVKFGSEYKLFFSHENVSEYMIHVVQASMG